MTTRTITVCTANLGRNGAKGEFAANLARVLKQTPGQHRFFQWQEIDEDDKPEEHRQLRAALPDGYSHAGWNTFTPISVPPGFDIIRPYTTHLSDGVKRLSPDRKLVQAVVAPTNKPLCRAVAMNTHLARRDPRLEKARRDATGNLEERVAHWHLRGLTSWLTADFNAPDYDELAPYERRVVDKGLDGIRVYEGRPDAQRPDRACDVRPLNQGTIDLTIDGHNCHWRRMELEW